MIILIVVLVFVLGLGVGYISHRPLVLTELDPRKCVCGHKHTSHKSYKGVRGAGGCTTGIGRERIGCACTVYIPEPETAKLPEGLL